MAVESSEFSEMDEGRVVPSGDPEGVSGTNSSQFAPLYNYSEDHADFLNSEEMDQAAVAAASNSLHADEVKVVMRNSDLYVQLPASVDEKKDQAAVIAESTVCEGSQVKMASCANSEEMNSGSENLDQAEEPNSEEMNSGSENLDQAEEANSKENVDQAAATVESDAFHGEVKEVMCSSDHPAELLDSGTNAFYISKVQEVMYNSDHHAELHYSCENLDNAALVEEYDTCDGREIKIGSCEDNIDPADDSENGEEWEGSFIRIGDIKIKLGAATGELINDDGTVSTIAYYCEEKEVSEAGQSTEEEEVDTYSIVVNEEDKETEIEYQTMIAEVESGTMIAEEHDSNTLVENNVTEARHQAELESDTEIGVPKEPSFQVKNSVGVERDNEHHPVMAAQTLLNDAEFSVEEEDNFSVHAISTQVVSGTMVAEKYVSNTVLENDKHCCFAGTDAEVRHQADLESDTEIGVPSEGEPFGMQSKGEPYVQVKNSVRAEEDNEHQLMIVAQIVLNETKLSAEAEDNFSVQAISSHKEDEDSEVVESRVGCEQSEDLGGIPTPAFKPAVSPLEPKRLETRRQPCYMITVPRFFDERLKTNMEDARSQLDENAKRRDSIRVEIKKRKAIHGEYWEMFLAAKDEEKAAKDVVSAKHKELDSVQSMINHVNKASSIDEIDNKISELEYKIQHNTIPLWQEKEYLREIKQLKQNRRELRHQLSEVEINNIVDNREQLEEEFKTLKAELESLRAVVLTTQRNTKAAWGKCNDEFQALKSLHEKLSITETDCQEVYEHIQHLRGKMTKRNSYYNIYRDDQRMAINYATVEDRKALRNLCENQVENVMHLFNTDEEFRQEYIKSNMKSTVRRLGTLDGRSLGPDENPPVLQSSYEISSTVVLPSPKGSLDEKPHVLPSSDEISSTVVLPSPKGSLDEKPHVLPSSDEISSTVVLPSPKGNSSTPILTLDLEIKEKNSGAIADGEHTAVKVANQTKEEIIPQKEEEGVRKEELTKKVEELERKNEEFREAQAASELKEQHRLEQKAKAKQAEERKRRQAEKAKAKAEYHAQKEAELREKKKAKKDKVGGSKHATNKKVEEDNVHIDTEKVEDNVHIDTAPSLSDPANEPEAPAKEPEASNKKIQQRSSRPQAHVKHYNKIEPLPLPLRERGKRKMTTWMWFFLTILLVVILFFAGNYISVPNLSMTY